MVYSVKVYFPQAPIGVSSHNNLYFQMLFNTEIHILATYYNLHDQSHLYLLVTCKTIILNLV